MMFASGLRLSLNFSPFLISRHLAVGFIEGFHVARSTPTLEIGTRAWSRRARDRIDAYAIGGSMHKVTAAIAELFVRCVMQLGRLTR